MVHKATAAVMTADRRWPWMHPVDGRDLPGLDTQQSRAVTRWARRIANRTTLTPWWNARTRAVHFCLGNNLSASPCAPTVLTREKSLRFPEADWVCRAIYSARMPERVKDRMIESARKAGENERIQAREKALEDSRPVRLDRARGLVRGRVSATTS